MDSSCGRDRDGVPEGNRAWVGVFPPRHAGAGRVHRRPAGRRFPARRENPMRLSGLAKSHRLLEVF